MYNVTSFSTKNTSIKDWKKDKDTLGNDVWYLEHKLDFKVKAPSDIDMHYYIITNPVKITYEGAKSTDYWKRTGMSVDCHALEDTVRLYDYSGLISNHI